MRASDWTEFLAAIFLFVCLIGASEVRAQQSCKASRPYTTPRGNWCSPRHDPPQPFDHFCDNRGIQPGPNGSYLFQACGYWALQVHAGVTAADDSTGVCEFVPFVNGQFDFAHPFSVAFELDCAPGAKFIADDSGYRCVAQTALDRDAIAKQKGDRIVREPRTGNILSIEHPAGNQIVTMANYDGFGRPGLIDDKQENGPVTVIWPADGGCMPNGLVIAGYQFGLKLDDQRRPLEVDAPDGSVHHYTYWPDGSVKTAWTTQGQYSATIAYADDGRVTSSNRVIVPTPVQSHHTSAATPGNPTVHWEIRQITQPPPISAGTVAVLATVTVGTIYGVPLLDRLQKSISDFYAAMLAQSLSPGQLTALECAELYETEKKLCEKFGAGFGPYGGNPSNGPGEIAACIDSARARHDQCVYVGVRNITIPLNLPGGIDWISY